MRRLFDELRERLLRAGVVPQHVRRYLAELSDHLADLTAEEEHAGRGRKEAEAVALVRVGRLDELAGAMIERPELQSWSRRAPWTVFGLGPILSLGILYFVACLILWSGWRIFLPGSEKPFVRLDGFAVLYFGVGRLLYYSAPILIGWGFAVVAARQRLRVMWPILSMVLLAWIGCVTRVRTIGPVVPGDVGGVSMGFGFGPSTGETLIYGAVMLSLMAAPYLVWQWHRARLAV